MIDLDKVTEVEFACFDFYVAARRLHDLLLEHAQHPELRQAAVATINQVVQELGQLAHMEKVKGGAR